MDFIIVIGIGAILVATGVITPVATKIAPIPMTIIKSIESLYLINC